MLFFDMVKNACFGLIMGCYNSPILRYFSWTFHCHVFYTEKEHIILIKICNLAKKVNKERELLVALYFYSVLVVGMKCLIQNKESGNPEAST